MTALLVPFSQALPAQADYIEGTSGSDLLNGTSDDDIIWAYGGADTVNGKGGGDEMHLGSGGDISSGGDGRDSTYGGASGSTYATADVMHGNQGGDYFRDVEADDEEWVCGEPQDDTIDVYDGDGDDWARGGDGTDTISRDSGDYWEQDGSAVCPP